MNRLISWRQSVLVRVILTLSMVGIWFLLSAALGYGNSFQAQAQPLTPEATQYQVNSKDSPFRDDEQEKVNQLFEDNKQPQTAPESAKKIGDNLTKPAKSIKQNLENAGETVKEKLNLD